MRHERIIRDTQTAAEGVFARAAAKDDRNASPFADAIIFLRVIARGGNYRRLLTTVPLLHGTEDRR